MSDASPSLGRGGGVATTALFAFAACALGLLGGLPFYVGPVAGGLGVLGSAVWRTYRPQPGWTVALAPALSAMTVLTATAPAAPSTELFAGLTGLAFLLWVADDPDRPAGGGRRAVPTIALAALAVALVWVVALALTGRTTGIGLTGGVLAIALILLAVLFARFPRPPSRPARDA